MTAPAIVFDLTAAQNALARSDEGAKALPGDAELIAALEGYCQQGYDQYEFARQDAEAAEYWAAQCSACVEGGTGPVCFECADEVPA